MKKIIAVVFIVVAAAECMYSQNINWRTLGDDRHNVVQFNFGYDFGATTRIGYSRYINTFRPVVLELEYSQPMGNELLDDFKVRYGGQIEVAEYGGFSATVKIYSNFRRHQTSMVRIVSFGSDVAALAGYYSSTWHTAVELGFDKSITSHIKNSDIMKLNFPAVHDGWYIPSGGHYYYGIQGSKTLGDLFDLSLRAGATNAQFNDENAILPVYLQLGLGLRF